MRKQFQGQNAWNIEKPIGINKSLAFIFIILYVLKVSSWSLSKVRFINIVFAISLR